MYIQENLSYHDPHCIYTVRFLYTYTYIQFILNRFVILPHESYTTQVTLYTWVFGIKLSETPANIFQRTTYMKMQIVTTEQRRIIAIKIQQLTEGVYG